MYYIANFSVISLDNEAVIPFHYTDVNASLIPEEDTKEMGMHVFCQADLWNIQRQRRTKHVTERLPRTWEGLW